MPYRSLAMNRIAGLLIGTAIDQTTAWSSSLGPGLRLFEPGASPLPVREDRHLDSSCIGKIAFEFSDTLLRGLAFGSQRALRSTPAQRVGSSWRAAATRYAGMAAGLSGLLDRRSSHLHKFTSRPCCVFRPERGLLLAASNPVHASRLPEF